MVGWVTSIAFECWVTLDPVGVGARRSNPLDLLDPVLEEAVIASDVGAQQVRGVISYRRRAHDPELRIVGVHAFPGLGVLREGLVSQFHQAEEAVSSQGVVVDLHQALPVRSHEPPHASHAWMDDTNLFVAQGSETNTIPPFVAVDVADEVAAPKLDVAVVIVPVLVVTGTDHTADRQQVTDGRVRCLFHPMLEHLSCGVGAVGGSVHGNDAVHHVRGVCSLLLVIHVHDLFVSTDVLEPPWAQASLPERLLLDLFAGDGMSTEVVFTPRPHFFEIHDSDLAELAVGESEEDVLGNATTVLTTVLVLELVAVGLHDPFEGCHGADPVGDYDDRLAFTRQANVLRAECGEVLTPRRAVKL